MSNKSQHISLAIIDQILMAFYRGQPDEAKMAAIRKRLVRRIADRGAGRVELPPAQPKRDTGCRSDLSGTGAIRKIRTVLFDKPKRHEVQGAAGCSKKTPEKRSDAVVCPTCYQPIKGHATDEHVENEMFKYIFEDHVVRQQYTG